VVYYIFGNCKLLCHFFNLPLRPCTWHCMGSLFCYSWYKCTWCSADWRCNKGSCFGLRTWSDKVRKLATMCLPWQHWTKALVWFDDDISAFHSCVVVDLWHSLFEWHLLVCVCYGVPPRECRNLN